MIQLPHPGRLGRLLAGAGLFMAVAATARPALAADPVAACDLQKGPCRQRLGAHEIVVTLAPRPIRPMQEQVLTVQVKRSGRLINNATVTADLTMVGMDMGPNRPVLKAIGRGLYEGKAVFPVCHSGTLDWAAAITVTTAGQSRTATFPLHLAPAEH
jgi:hypothetical protein